MASKNRTKLGPSKNVKPIPIWHVIPPSNESDYKFTIETDNETIDLSDEVIKGSITDGATRTIGSFEIEIIDPDKIIYNKFTTFDTLKFYADYGEPTTLRFSGYIERKGYQDIYTVISGRSISMIFSNKNIIYNSDGPKKRSEIIKEIISQNFSKYNINVDDIEEDNTELDVNYYEVPMVDIIEEICGSTHDFYLDHSFNAHYFTKGSRQNPTDGISEDQNHIETPDNAFDTENTYTKARIYGKAVGDLPLLYTSDSNISNTKGVEKEYKENNNSIISTNKLKSYTELKYNSVNQIPKVGTHSSLLLPTIQPGEKLFVAIPREDISPGYYVINSYTHDFDLSSDNDRTTTINIIKRRDQISDIMKRRIQTETRISENPNPNNLNFSEVIKFDEDSGTHNNTRIIGGNLSVVDGYSSGRWISDIINLDSPLSGIEVRMSGESLIKQYGVNTSALWFSLDGGTTWKLNPPSGEIDSIPLGRRLRFRIDLNSPDASVNSVGALYSY